MDKVLLVWWEARHFSVMIPNEDVLLELAAIDDVQRSFGQFVLVGVKQSQRATSTMPAGPNKPMMAVKTALDGSGADAAEVTTS